MYRESNPESNTITQPAIVELIEPTGRVTPIEAEFVYDKQDPYAMTTRFISGETVVSWTFGRDLVASGLYEATGDGDVHVWPCLDSEGQDVVIIELCSPEGEALVQAKSIDLEDFVQRMDSVVPEGRESAQLDVDAWITEIYNAEA